MNKIISIILLVLTLYVMLIFIAPNLSNKIAGNIGLTEFNENLRKIKAKSDNIPKEHQLGGNKKEDIINIVVTKDINKNKENKDNKDNSLYNKFNSLKEKTSSLWSTGTNSVTGLVNDGKEKLDSAKQTVNSVKRGIKETKETLDEKRKQLNQLKENFDKAKDSINQLSDSLDAITN